MRDIWGVLYTSVCTYPFEVTLLEIRARYVSQPPKQKSKSWSKSCYPLDFHSFKMTLSPSWNSKVASGDIWFQQLSDYCFKTSLVSRPTLGSFSWQTTVSLSLSLVSRTCWYVTLWRTLPSNYVLCNAVFALSPNSPLIAGKEQLSLQTKLLEDSEYLEFV